MDTGTWGWLIAGGALMASEIFIPGGVVVFLGLGAVTVALGRVVGMLGGWVDSVLTFFVVTLFYLVTLRSLLARYFSGESAVTPPPEDVAAYGEIVEVVETVGEDDQRGRIRMQDSTWPAISLRGTIPAGSRAVIAYRDNLIWIVEPLEEKSSSDPEEVNGAADQF